MKINEKLISESTRDTITSYIGFFAAIAGLILFIFKFEYFFAGFILLVYIILPPVYAVIDMIKGKLRRTPLNLFIAILYNYLATFYDIFSIIVLVPVIAIDILLGPMSIILFIVGILLLGLALVQWLSGSRLGASDMTNPETLMITIPLTAVTGTLLFLNYYLYKNGLTQWLADRVLGGLRLFIEMFGSAIDRPVGKKTE